MIKAEVGKFYVRLIEAGTYELEPQERRTIMKCEAIESEPARNGTTTFLIKMTDELGDYKWEYIFDANAPNLPETRTERTPYMSAIYREARNDEIEEYKKNSELAKKESAHVNYEKSEILPDFGYVSE